GPPHGGTGPTCLPDLLVMHLGEPCWTTRRHDDSTIVNIVRALHRKTEPWTGRQMEFPPLGVVGLWLDSEYGHERLSETSTPSAKEVRESHVMVFRAAINPTAMPMQRRIRNAWQGINSVSGPMPRRSNLYR